MSSRRVALVLEYDGTAYAGWQRQPTVPTIQAALEDTLASLVQSPCPVVGAGRTDAGVHAIGQVAHLTTSGALFPTRMRDALNALLPPDIAVRAAIDVAPDFHARRDARLRVYRYALLLRPHPSALLRRYAHHIAAPLDLDAMRAGAAPLAGRHDFAAYRVTGTSTGSTICTVRTVRIERRGDLGLVTIAADRFLRQMVRRVVGTLLMVGRGALAPEAVAAILQSRDNQRAGPPAPAHGLYLVRVAYAPDRLPHPASERAVL
jgi:tRNA pseudouridine38-40 synthase